MPTGDHAVIVAARRTPIGKMMGGLAAVPAPQLGAAAIEALFTGAGSVLRDRVDEAIVGHVLTAGVGQAPARQAMRAAGLADGVRATTINRVCGSGLKAVMLADQAIRCGDAQVVVAGGQENMSATPHLLPGARAGFRFGASELKDHMQWDGLWDPYGDVAMGQCGEQCAEKYAFSREAQDEYAAESYRRARAAAERGDFADELVPVKVKGRKGKELEVAADEEPTSVDLERLPGLRPAFRKDGTITAGNASSINDGAAMVLVVAEKLALQLGLEPLGRIAVHDSFAQEPSWFTTAPIASTRQLLTRTGLAASDIDYFEVNEAFSVVAMAAIQELGLPPERVNARGGAVALGHPIGASGARILVTLLHTMRAEGAKRGLVSICLGGGEASSLLVERL